jgi:hypothetical protein
MADCKSSSARTIPQISTELRDAENAEMVRRIAARMTPTKKPSISVRNLDTPLNRRHTGTTIRALAWPVWVQGRRCTCCVRVTYVESHPRQHTAETFWFANVEEAQRAFPNARVLDAPQVQGHMKPQYAYDDVELRDAALAMAATPGA